MPDTQIRLIRCFRAVFPELTENEVVHANMGSTANWDSMATVTLIAVVEEEFGMRFEVDELENMNSFQRFLVRLTP